MKLLAFETATEACSVAVWDDGRVLERFDVVPRQHATLALPWAEALLAEAGIARSQLDAVAVGQGPGAFTGVRLAIALAQGLALGLDRPLLAHSTLAVLAMRAQAASGVPVLAAIDARMGEVYHQTFTVSGPEQLPVAVGPAQVAAPSAVALPAALAGRGDWVGVGTGFAAAEGALRLGLADALGRVDADALPHAGDLARLAAVAFARGEGQSPELVEPVYLRNNVALTLEEQAALRASRSPAGTA